MRAVIADGLDATVHRVGGLAGDSPAGTFLAGPRGTVLYRLLRVITGCGLVPDAPGFTVNLTPAGFAAGAVLRLWAATANSGRAFHVRNPADLTMPGLTALPRDLGYPVILADPERIARWLARDGASGAEREALPFLGQFAGQPGTLIRCDTLAPSSGATRRRHARRLPI